MRIDRAALIRGMLIAANQERERRQAAEEARVVKPKERLFAELEEMGRRMLAVSVPGRDLRDAELAEQLGRAPDWAHIDEVRVAADVSAAETVALVWRVDPERAAQLLGAYPFAINGCGSYLAPRQSGSPGSMQTRRRPTP